MPTVISRGAGSARGFGFASGGAGTTLQTVTFTSNSTWVAPAGVSLVTTLVGRGQDGSTAYWTDIFSADGGIVSYVQSDAPSGISSTTVEARAQVEWDKFPTSYDPNGAVVDWTYWYYFSVGVQQYPQTALIRLKQGFSKTKVGNGWGTTYTTPFPFGSYRSYAVGNMEQYVGASNGADSSGLGYTFPGGVEGPAPTLTYNNVAVTPSTSYSIVVPSGGAVTLQYYA